MKKTLLITLCLSLFLYSCKKKSEAPKNTIAVTVDGATKSFTTGTVATISNEIALGSNLSVTGSAGSGTGAESISLQIVANSSIAKGTYKNDGSNGFMSILYSAGNFSLTNPNYYTTDVHGTYPSLITITSISGTNVQGTFSGQLLFTDGKTVKSVTDGKFNVDIQ